MPLSQYSRNKTLELIHGKTAFTLPTAFIGLSTTTPTATDTNITEPVGNGYARVATTGATWGVAAAGAITNTSVITFPTATGAGLGTVTNVVVYDALTGGNLLFWGTITSQAVAAGVAVTIPVSNANCSVT
jgi:hypothetical protein